MKRRDFLKTAATLPLVLATLGTGCSARRRTARRVLVLGIDGMDHFLLNSFIHEGIMPNAARLATMGGLNLMSTSNPPQSPVAWSGFITGKGPQVHGIFDFIHRNPMTRTPYLSTSRVMDPGKVLKLGEWRLPLSGAKVELLRHGEPFWNSLTEQGIPVTMVKLPVEFPPGNGKARILSGLGTPDLRGSQGSFTFFTDDARSITDDTAGGIVVPVRDYGDGCYRCPVRGPENSMRAGNPKMEIMADVWVDRDADALRIDVGGRSTVLGRGQWSDWIELEFQAIPHVSSVKGIVRFYAKEISPRLKLYMSPINIHPMDPALPISNPHGLSGDLAREVGLYYTQGFPEDTKALSRGILNDEEYLHQAWIVFKERLSLFHHELNRFKAGLLFFYFSSLDLNIHMFYRTIDPFSPLHESTDPRFKAAVRELYAGIDGVIGDAMDILEGDDRLLVISDHGFAPFNRSFNLNSWLAGNGYVSVSLSNAGNRDMFEGVDWSGTAAYGLGLNSLYLNLAGRENGGIVKREETPELLTRLKRELESITDPVNGKKVISNAFITSEIFPGPLPPHAPDMIIGYSRGYRASWKTTLGGFPKDVLTDNTDPWSGTHCIDPAIVPCVLLSNMRPEVDDPDLTDMGRSIAGMFDISRLPEGGRDIFRRKENSG